MKTMWSLKIASIAAQWLKRDLQRVDRCVTPWVVLAMHRPMYVVFPHKSNRVFAGPHPTSMSKPHEPILYQLVCCTSLH